MKRIYKIIFAEKRKSMYPNCSLDSNMVAKRNKIKKTYDLKRYVVKN